MWRNALMLRCMVIVMFHALNVRCKDDEAVWLQLKEWVISNKGTVHPSLKSNMTYHRGFPVRGIITTESHWSWTPVLTVPRSLWIEPTSFPETRDVSLPAVCTRMHSPSDGDSLRFAAGLALENKKGSESFYYPWLRSLPSFADFHSFFPRLMEPTVQRDFAALPLTAAMWKAQQQDAAIQDCFQAWQKEPSSPVSSLTWDDISAMLCNYRTRSLDAGGSGFMIPAMDLMNTENSNNVNTQWSFALEDFTLSTEMAGLESGAELTEEYCPGCSNFLMMAIWGIFLEDNLNDLDEADTSFCHGGSNFQGVSNTTSNKSSAMQPSLRYVAEEMLDIPHHQDSKWRAPRCRAEKVMASEQGPLRCSLARLAWEQCHADWHANSSMNMLQPKEANSKLRGANKISIDGNFVTLLSQSFIGAVHPKLLPCNSSTSTRQHPGASRSLRMTSHRSIVQDGMMLSTKRVL
eukprot:gnl/MRDRNA2_/MRDRNA2_123224_c0_seq1.p1 gnl/MRDRNA2_/MRDRNA2_123224_c0~~gnl/MRDRNA2_/MRDRNA2_123224_c0_seq1.p1  ORF type:complete len:462 (-),score=65.60 gnl/MRDRNA2_/MRDRNA2_123224_c0_seq1:22-1407(-)